MLKRVLPLILIALFIAANAFATPTDDLKKVVDEVVQIVSDKDMKSNPQKRRIALRKSIGSIFDYEEMSKRSLGKHWSARTAEEKKQFADLFANLLEKTYVNKIESYNNEKIAYIRERVEGQYAEIKSKVTIKQEEYSLDYRLINKGGKWVVYDVVIEGVSLVANYRGQFAKIMSSGGYNELVKKLQEK